MTDAVLGRSLRTLRLTLRRRAVNRQRRISPTRDWTASAIFLAIGVGVGLSSLPHRPSQGPSAARLADPLAAADAAIAPAVFALRDSGVAVRFGNAETTADGIIRVGFYDPLDPLLVTATEPVSLPADARLLWLLASAAERDGIREKISAFVVALSSSVRDILTSPEFAADYRDRFLAVFQASTRASWQVMQENGAWRGLLRSVEPMLRELVTRDIRPMLERHFRGLPSRMLRANAVAMLDPFTDRPWNMEPVEDAMRAAIQELRDRGVAERIVGQLMDSPQAAQFLRSFQNELARDLTRNATLQGLVAEMVFDERFRPYAAEAILRANDLSRFAPRLLVSLRGSKELNLVAATVIRATIAGRGDRVVVFMTPAQRDEVQALDRTAVHPLERLGRP